MPNNWPFWRVLIILVLLSSIASWGTYWYFQTNKPTPLTTNNTQTNPSERSTAAVTNKTIEILEDRVESLENVVASLSAKTPSTTQQTSQPTATIQTSTQQTPREYYVYVGSGNTTSREWTDLTGTTVSIDTNFYNPISSVTFEAALSILGGEAHARLINQTTGAILASTEVYNNTSTSVWKSSPTFSLQPGKNTYLVQLRSSSGERAQLDGARIKIIVK